MITLYAPDGTVSTLPNWVDINYYLAKGFSKENPIKAPKQEKLVEKKTK